MTDGERIAAAPIPVWVALLRPAHWVKNLLLFVPPLFAHAPPSPRLLADLLIGIVAMSLAASSGYVVNDMLDASSDRLHAKKRHRAIASGRIGVRQASLIALALGAGGVFLAIAALGASVGALVAVYLLATVCYSRYLKRVLALDVAVLAALYVWRLAIGGAIAGIELSPWLAGFAASLFLSLALMKRIDELFTTERTDWVSRRAYGPRHRPGLIVLCLVSVAACIAILVAYITVSDLAALHYRRVVWLWAATAFFILWLLHVFRQSMRGRIAGDPVLFAASDPASLALAAGVAAAFFAAI